jgi:lysine-specific demethylase 3
VKLSLNQRTIAKYIILELLLWQVEINIRQDFTGSLKCQPLKNDWYEMLKLNGWLSSQLFKEQFPAHFAEVIGTLPIQDYIA